MQAQSIIFAQPWTVEVREETVAPPGPGEVCCAAERSLISIGTELSCLRGEFEPGTNWAEWLQYPFHPGYSMAARVVDLGPGVTGLKEGDRVAAWVPHQQFFTIPAAELHPVPEPISPDEATWAILACTTQLAVRRAELQLGETIGVVGLGMLGQLVVQYTALCGARRIIAIDRAAGRLDAARAHGATHVLALDVCDAYDPVAEITGGRMLDALFEVTGHPAVLAPSLHLLRRFGRVVLLGDTPMPSQQHLGPGLVSNSLSLLGIHGSAYPAQRSDFAPWTAREMSALFFDYLLQHRMRVADLITRRCAPLEAPQVYVDLARDRTRDIGVMFEWY